MKTSKYTIAIDSDGVICDFSRKVVEILKIIPKEELSTIARIDESIIDKKRMWGAIDWHDRHVEPFFESLQKMCDADQLIDFVRDTFEDYFILTAKGSTPKDGGEQKLRWYKKHYEDLRVEIVIKSADKAQFATPHTILIDDRAKSIDPWIAAGGIGILHTDTKSTIEKIKTILTQSI